MQGKYLRRNCEGEGEGEREREADVVPCKRRSICDLFAAFSAASAAASTGFAGLFFFLYFFTGRLPNEGGRGRAFK